MAKMRVHELAKELNIKSQDILDKLKNTKFDGKSASSNMEEEAQALVRGAFSKEAKPAADVKKTEVAKAGATNKNVQRRNPASQPYLMHSTANSPESRQTEITTTVETVITEDGRTISVRHSTASFVRVRSGSVQCVRSVSVRLRRQRILK